MHPRNLHLYFFSPTGGTQRVAGLFAENLNAADACTDITVCAEAKTFSADDCLLVFFPVYGGRVPGPCLERVRALRGADTPAVLVAVFGNRAVDDALLEMRDTLARWAFTSWRRQRSLHRTRSTRTSPPAGRTRPTAPRSGISARS